LFAIGVTVIVPVCGIFVLFVALNAAISPVPCMLSPMVWLSLSQVNTVLLTVPLKFTAFVVAPAHSVWSALEFTVGLGFTVMLKLFVAPVQPLAVGVTTIVAVTGVTPVFVAVKELIFPVPLAARPMVVLLFVHVYTVPVTLPLKFTALVAVPLHLAWSLIFATVGVGLTVIVNKSAGPVQPLADGVTIIVATSGAVPLLTAANEGTSPIPVAASPIDVLLLVQLKVVPATGPLTVTCVVAAPLQTAWSAIAFTIGVGFTVIVRLPDGPAQPFAVGVTVIVAVTGVLPLFVAEKEAIFPVPLPASPIEGVLFVHAYVVPDTPPLKLILPVAAPLHLVRLVSGFSVGVGFTRMVNISFGPVQPLAVGDTVIVAITGDNVLLIAAKAEMFPVPEAGNPMLLLLFVQAYVVPDTPLPKFMAVVFTPLHTAWSATVLTVGIGLTVIVKLLVVPTHPFADGVTVIVAVAGVLVVFCAVKDGIFPVPLAPSPIVTSLFVHV
jgi:hypothetical protein